MIIKHFKTRFAQHL